MPISFLRLRVGVAPNQCLPSFFCWQDLVLIGKVINRGVFLLSTACNLTSHSQNKVFIFDGVGCSSFWASFDKIFLRVLKAKTYPVMGGVSTNLDHQVAMKARDANWIPWFKPWIHSISRKYPNVKTKNSQVFVVILHHFFPFRSSFPFLRSLMLPFKWPEVHYQTDMIRSLPPLGDVRVVPKWQSWFGSGKSQLSKLDELTGNFILHAKFRWIHWGNLWICEWFLFIAKLNPLHLKRSQRAKSVRRGSTMP